MTEFEIRRVRSLLFFLAVATLAAGAADVALGSLSIPLRDLWRVLTGGTPSNPTFGLVIYQLRLPRSLAALGGGAALALAGALLQTFFHNPIVEPYVLGLSSGASLAVAAVMFLGLSGATAVWPLFGGALVGTLVVLMAVLWAARRLASATSLLVVGLMIGFLCSAVTTIFAAFAETEGLAGFALWAMGSFAGFDWPAVALLWGLGVPLALAAFGLSRGLNALALGEETAQGLGLNLTLFRPVVVGLAGGLTALVTAFAGPVAFIGLAVPHLCRLALRTADHRAVLPAAALGGALMASLCDLAARTLASPHELPVSGVTAALGAPLVIWLLLARRENRL